MTRTHNEHYFKCFNSYLALDLDHLYKSRRTMLTSHVEQLRPFYLLVMWFYLNYSGKRSKRIHLRWSPYALQVCIHSIRSAHPNDQKIQFRMNKFRFLFDLKSSGNTVLKLHKALVSGSSSGGCVTAFCGKISANCNRSCNPGIRNATACCPKFKMIQ